MNNIVVVGVVRYNETSGEIMDPEKRCGSTLTYAYFVSFIFLCRYSGQQPIGWKDGNYQPIGWEHGSYQSQSDRRMVITVHKVLCFLRLPGSSSWIIETHRKGSKSLLPVRILARLHQKKRKTKVCKRVIVCWIPCTIYVDIPCVRYL